MVGSILSIYLAGNRVDITSAGLGSGVIFGKINWMRVRLRL